ncbi:MAG: hypothetical protein ACT4P1_10145 [Sporichthyaceae bacterium]
MTTRTRVTAGLFALAAVAAGIAAAPASPANAAETGPACVGFDVLEIKPGLMADKVTKGTVNHVGPLGEETCTGDSLGYKATGPIGIEHYINYEGTCTDLLLTGYALHHIPTADGVKTVRNNFTAAIGYFVGDKFSGTYTVSELEGDCGLTAPLTKFRADYAGYYNDNTRD